MNLFDETKTITNIRKVTKTLRNRNRNSLRYSLVKHDGWLTIPVLTFDTRTLLMSDA